MKAMVRRSYGSPDVLRLEEIQKPAARDDELLIRVHAVSLNLGDWEVLTADPLYIAVLATIFGPPQRLDPVPSTTNGAAASRSASGGLLRPKQKILAGDIAGRVEMVGRNVTQFQPGDDLFGMCGFGALAEYVCLPEDAVVVRKPAGMTFEEAAAIPQAAFIALQGMRDKGELRSGQKVLINGAGGGAGTLAVQIAKSLGAEVTGVDRAHKLDMMRAIGADHVIDYTQADFTRTAQRYDVILDLAAHRSVFDCRRVLTPQGIYLLAGGSLTPTLQALLLGAWTSMTGGRRVAFLLAEDRRDDLVLMTELHRAGTVVPVIDRSYPLSEAAEAFRCVGEGRSNGKVVITL